MRQMLLMRLLGCKCQAIGGDAQSSNKDGNRPSTPPPYPLDSPRVKRPNGDYAHMLTTQRSLAMLPERKLSADTT
jgi:hypothetical protein